MIPLEPHLILPSRHSESAGKMTCYPDASSCGGLGSSPCNFNRGSRLPGATWRQLARLLPILGEMAV